MDYLVIKHDSSLANINTIKGYYITTNIEHGFRKVPIESVIYKVTVQDDPNANPNRLAVLANAEFAKRRSKA